MIEMIRKISKWAKIPAFFVLTAALAGCGIPKRAEDAQSTGAVYEETRSEGQKILKLAMTQNEDSVVAETAAYLRDRVWEETKGAVLIELYPDSGLGDQMKFLKGMELGTVELCIVSMGVLEEVDTRFQVMAPMFGISDETGVTAWYESEEVEDQFNRLEDRTGLIRLAEVYEGYRNIWSKEPIPELSALRGKRVRVPEAGTLYRFFEILETEPVIMAWNEAYSSLQAGGVDAVEIDMESVVDNRIYHGAPYCLETRHLFSDCTLLVTRTAMDHLTQEEQEILKTCAGEAEEYARELYWERQKEAREFLSGQGVVFSSLTKEDQERLTEIMGQINSGSLESGAEEKKE